MHNFFMLYRIDEFGIKDYKNRYLIVAALLLLYGIVCLVANVLVFFEVGADGANITTYWDAVWLLTMVASTIGFGDVFPVTGGGRITVGFISFVGVGIYSFITALIAGKLMSKSDTSIKNRELRAQNSRIEELAKKILIEEQKQSEALDGPEPTKEIGVGRNREA